MATVKLNGDPVNTNGDLPSVGATAPGFELTDPELKEVSLDSLSGKRKLLNIVPSIDTGVCALSSRKFDEAARDNPQAAFLVISADLPFAMDRFGKSENLDNVHFLSLMRSRQFAEDYGVLLVDGPLAGITTRAVVVLDENNRVVHTELVDDITHEPDYDAALQALAD
jgi:thiol peroxidase